MLPTVCEATRPCATVTCLSPGCCTLAVKAFVTIACAACKLHTEAINRLLTLETWLHYIQPTTKLHLFFLQVRVHQKLAIRPQAAICGGCIANTGLQTKSFGIPQHDGRMLTKDVFHWNASIC